jgi:hypothetical protein
VAVAQKERSQRGSVRIQTLNLAVCQPVLGFRLTYPRNAKSQTEKPRPHKAFADGVFRGRSQRCGEVGARSVRGSADSRRHPRITGTSHPPSLLFGGAAAARSQVSPTSRAGRGPVASTTAGRRSSRKKPSLWPRRGAMRVPNIPPWLRNWR